MLMTIPGAFSEASKHTAVAFRHPVRGDAWIDFDSALSRSIGTSSFEHIMAHSVSAINAEKATADPSAIPSSENRRPVEPSRNTIGTNTAISTAVVASTAKATCCVPRTAAIKAGSPSSMRRWTFSSTTMASSTTSPMASTKCQQREQVHRCAKQPREGSLSRAGKPAL
jgi:hypothetical protein